MKLPRQLFSSTATNLTPSHTIPSCSVPTNYLGGAFGSALGLPLMLPISCGSLIDVFNALYLATICVLTALLGWLAQDPHYAHFDIWNSAFGQCWKRLLFATGTAILIKAAERWWEERAGMIIGVGVALAMAQAWLYLCRECNGWAERRRKRARLVLSGADLEEARSQGKSELI